MMPFSIGAPHPMNPAQSAAWKDRLAAQSSSNTGQVVKENR